MRKKTANFYTYALCMYVHTVYFERRCVLLVVVVTKSHKNFGHCGVIDENNANKNNQCYKCSENFKLK